MRIVIETDEVRPSVVRVSEASVAEPPRDAGPAPLNLIAVLSRAPGVRERSGGEAATDAGGAPRFFRTPGLR